MPNPPPISIHCPLAGHAKPETVKPHDITLMWNDSTFVYMGECPEFGKFNVCAGACGTELPPKEEPPKV